MTAQQVVEFIGGPWAGKQGLVSAPVPGIIRPAGAELTFLGASDPPVQATVVYRWIDDDNWYQLQIKPTF